MGVFMNSAGSPVMCSCAAVVVSTDMCRSQPHKSCGVKLTGMPFPVKNTESSLLKLLQLLCSNEYVSAENRPETSWRNSVMHSSGSIVDLEAVSAQPSQSQGRFNTPGSAAKDPLPQLQPLQRGTEDGLSCGFHLDATAVKVFLASNDHPRVPDAVDLIEHPVIRVNNNRRPAEDGRTVDPQAKRQVTCFPSRAADICLAMPWERS